MTSCRRGETPSPNHPPSAHPNQPLSPDTRSTNDYISHRQHPTTDPLQTSLANQRCCQHGPNQLKCLMSVLYNTNTAIKEHLKRVRGYRVEGCGLWCHGLLVFKQRLVSIKAAFTSASGVSMDPNGGDVMIHTPRTFINSSRADENDLPPYKEPFFYFICEHRDMQGKINKKVKCAWNVFEKTVT